MVTAQGHTSSLFNGVGKPSALIPSAARAPRTARLPSLRSASIENPVVETMELGKSGVEVSSIGIGAWSWGDRSGYWGYGSEYGKEDSREVFKSLIDAGITFIDTAEVYGYGKSEEFIGEFSRELGAAPVIGTKFAPLPWRQTSGTVPNALRASLNRLQMDSVGLYMIHWPGFFLNAFSNDAYVEGLATCVKEGLTKAIGVSNFREDRIRSAHRVLGERGIPLATNQVQYSLLYRQPERNGVLETCKELGITPVAYSPLCQGLLTGKYTPDNLPGGQRKLTLKSNFVTDIQPLLKLMKEIGEKHDGKTCAQVAINWVLCKGALPIPGAKTIKQMEEITGALGWRLTADEVEALDDLSGDLTMSTGAPFENW